NGPVLGAYCSFRARRRTACYKCETFRQGDFTMETLIDFFALRPTFTFYGIKIVWYLYLTNTIVQTYVSVSGISRILAQKGVSMEVWLPNSIPLLLGIIAQLALVRLLLEVAAILVSSRSLRAPQ